MVFEDRSNEELVLMLTRYKKYFLWFIIPGAIISSQSPIGAPFVLVGMIFLILLILVKYEIDERLMQSIHSQS
ncbi:MAG: hypothetical protein OEY49_08870 [Candidatus Heimdallarchaeota archaeon]|nr:hypothetical protein [Candidatus Heimdallarchaeota archaeon]